MAEQVQVKSKEQEKAQLAAAKFNSAAALLEQCWLTVGQFRGAPKEDSVRASLTATLFISLDRKGVELI
jgi:hypothetical protein